MDQTSPTLVFLTLTDTSFTLNFSNSSGPLANYSGKLYLTLKKNINDSDAQAALQIPLTFTTDANGNATLSITHTQMVLPIAYYWYDFTIIAGGSVTKSYPGQAEVRQSVTQAVI